MQHKHLPRLTEHYYKGFSTIHWNMSFKDRSTGWLTESFHPVFRELMLHALVTYDLICPVYCMMPDHIHMLWRGISLHSDQRKGLVFFRTHLNRRIAPYAMQKQVYDHVLRREDLERDAFVRVAFYIAENPVRGGLIAESKRYPFSGCVLPGKPSACIFDVKYWDAFWVYYEKLLKKSGWMGWDVSHGLSPAATEDGNDG